MRKRERSGPACSCRNSLETTGNASQRKDSEEKGYESSHERQKNAKK
jgi:hypothetical protein